MNAVSRSAASAGIIAGLAAPAFAQAQIDVPLILGAGAGPACVEEGRVSGLDLRGDSFLAVRTGPGAHYAQIDSLHNGDDIVLCAREGAWLGIVYPARADCGLDRQRPDPGPYAGPCSAGWVHGDRVAEQSSLLDVAVTIGTQPDRPACPMLGEVRGLDPEGDGFLAIRSGPGIDYAKLDELYESNAVYVCGYEGTWRAIVYPADGRECGVSGLLEGPRGYDGPCFRGWANSRWIAESPAPLVIPPAIEKPAEMAAPEALQPQLPQQPIGPAGAPAGPQRAQ
jgi:hypothetical protein